MFYIRPYNMASESARSLKQALGALLIKLEGSRYRKKRGDVVINWGNSSDFLFPVDFNQPHNVGLASNKLLTFQALMHADVQTVPFTTDPNTANSWLDEGSKVFVRHSLTGHSGEGIEIIRPTMHAEEDDFFAEIRMILQELREDADTPERVSLLESLLRTYNSSEVNVERQIARVPNSPLYTKGLTNHGEYRVHVFNGDVILYQKKSRRVDEEGNVITAEGEDAEVRNLASNWVYRTGNLRRLERVEQLAVRAINAIGLDFGAVDIIKDADGNVFVLEINSAPGLGNTETLQAYVDAFSNI